MKNKITSFKNKYHVVGSVVKSRKNYTICDFILIIFNGMQAPFLNDILMVKKLFMFTFWCVSIWILSSASVLKVLIQ